ncbi:hypothetical protein GCM10023264_19270 [Sphingomonas daechungensis]
MAKRRVNPNVVKLNRNYDTTQLATCCGVHKNTVLNWRTAGLEPIDSSKPILFHGSVVREFLKQRNAKRKQPCGPGKLYCFSCREPRRPALGFVEYVLVTQKGGNLKAFCETCETVMHRKIRRADLEAKMPGVEVQFADRQLRLIGTPSPSLNCDPERQAAA